VVTAGHHAPDPVVHAALRLDDGVRDVGIARDPGTAGYGARCPPIDEKL
jgi:hypothetical protein